MWKKKTVRKTGSLKPKEACFYLSAKTILTNRRFLIYV